MKTKTLFRVTLVTLIMSASVTAETRLKAVRADKPPVLDGKFDDSVWAKAMELRLKAEGRSGPTEGQETTVVLKAAYDEDNVYLLLRWRDATKDDTHKSYIWSDQKSAYEIGPDREDVASLSFPIRGEFTADMLSGREELWDVWHWKAHRTAPAGYAMDKTHVFFSTKPSGKAKKFHAKDGSEVWIARPEDAGGSVTRQHPAPGSKQTDPPVRYEAVTPSGSAADVRTGQSYREGWWTVEFARKLKTGYADDVEFSVPDTYPMAVAVFDKSEDEDHYTAGPIILEFENAAQLEEVFTFDQDTTGDVPSGWSIRQTNPTQTMATWQVIADPTAPSKPNVMALTQTENYDHTFNLAITRETFFKDLDLTVQVKAVSGDEDQGGGLIWRCKDQNNYYICRFNPLESNYRVYKVVNGQRKQLDSVKVKTQAGKWYRVRVTMAGDHITCYLDDKKMLEAKDGTFTEPGMIGLWTKADAATRFDDLTARVLR